MIRGKRLLVTVLLLVVSCATPPFGSADQVDTSTSIIAEPTVDPSTSSATTLNYGAESCDLRFIVMTFDVIFLGSVVSLERGLKGLPGDPPEREHAVVTFQVDTVGASSQQADLPRFAVGDQVDAVVYPDQVVTPVDLLAKATETSGSLVVGMAYLEADPGSQPGPWVVQRFGEGGSDGVTFTGFCAEYLNDALDRLAETTGRPPDVGLVFDLADEILPTPDEIGPMEQVLLDSP